MEGSQVRRMRIVAEILATAGNLVTDGKLLRRLVPDHG